MIAPQCEIAPARQHVQIFIPVGVPEIAPFAAHVAFIEANGLEHFDKCRVDMIGVQVVFATFVLFQPVKKIVVHHGFSAASVTRSKGRHYSQKVCLSRTLLFPAFAGSAASWYSFADPISPDGLESVPVVMKHRSLAETRNLKPRTAKSHNCIVHQTLRP